MLRKFKLRPTVAPQSFFLVICLCQDLSLLIMPVSVYTDPSSQELLKFLINYFYYIIIIYNNLSTMHKQTHTANKKNLTCTHNNSLTLT